MAAGDTYVDVSGVPRARAAVLKVTSAGGKDWMESHLPGGKEYSNGDRIVVDGAGAAYLAGWSDGGPQAEDFLTVKYDSAGAFKWAKVWQGSEGEDDLAESIALGPRCVYVGGYGVRRGDVGQSVVIKYAP